MVFDKFGEFDKAMSDFTSAISLDSTNPIYIHNRGCCLRSVDKLIESVRDFEVALNLDPTNPVILSNLG